MLEKIARQLSPLAWQALNTPCDTKAKKKRRAASLEYAVKCVNAMREPDKEILNTLHKNVFAFGPEKAWDHALDMIADPSYFGK